MRNSFIPAATNLGTMNKFVGDHDITFDKIFDIVKNALLDGYTLVGEFPTAAQVLRKALNIGIRDNKFYHVTLGDIRVLICNEYLGAANQDRVFDFFMVDGIPTLFIFSDCMKSEKVRRDVRVSRIIDLFTVLVELMSTQEYMNIVGSIYYKVIMAAPIVLTVKVIKAVYGRNFVYDKDWNPDYYSEEFGWFDQNVVDAVYAYGTDELLNFGAVSLFIDNYNNY